MSQAKQKSVESRWARVGVLFNCALAAPDPDLERLLLDTAREVHANPRLLPLAVTWLTEYGNFVARHRLARLISTELEPEPRAALGLILDLAIGHGAPGELRTALAACAPVAPPRPLSRDFAASPSLVAVAQRNASAPSRHWGLWTPPVELKRDALRPVSWVLARNPAYRDRIIRKGDLRCSILEALRHDAAGRTHSESELARLAGATRAAVRKALRALVQEGAVVIQPRAENGRDHAVVLRSAA
jgi:hypothetical protein